MRGRETRPLQGTQSTRESGSGTPSGNTKRSENAPSSGVSKSLSLAIPWLSSRPPGRSRLAQAARVDVDLLLAHVLDHADAGDRVERPVGHLAVVGHAELHPVGHAGLAGALAGQLAPAARTA